MIAVLIAALIVPCVTLATTNDLTIGSGSATAGMFSGKRYVSSRVLDTRANPLIGTNVYKLVTIPANNFLSAVGYRVTRVTTNACTLDIGNGTSGTAYFTAVRGTNIDTSTVSVQTGISVSPTTASLRYPSTNAPTIAAGTQLAPSMTNILAAAHVFTNFDGVSTNVLTNYTYTAQFAVGLALTNAAASVTISTQSVVTAVSATGGALGTATAGWVGITPSQDTSDLVITVYAIFDDLGGR